MRFLLDHDVPADLARVLVRSEHEVIRLDDILPRTAKDVAVFAEASRRDAILVTCNRDDFLCIAESRLHPGLIVLVRRRTRVAECAAMLRLLARAGESGISNNVNFA